MPAFDTTKDITLRVLGEVPADEKSQTIIIEIKSYNGSEPRLSMVRTWKNAKGAQKYRPLGRMSQGELFAVLGILNGFGEERLRKVFRIAARTLKEKKKAALDGAQAHAVEPPEPARHTKKKPKTKNAAGGTAGENSLDAWSKIILREEKKPKAKKPPKDADLLVKPVARVEKSQPDWGEDW